MAAISHQNAVARQFLEEGRTVLAKVGYEEIRETWINTHMAFLEFTRKPDAQPLGGAGGAAVETDRADLQRSQE